MWIGVVVIVLGSLAVAEVGRRSARGGLPRNHVIGIRVPRTLADDESWDVAHRAAGPVLVITGVAAAVVAVLGGLLGAVTTEAAAAVILVVACIALASGVLLAARRGLQALPPG